MTATQCETPEPRPVLPARFERRLHYTLAQIQEEVLRGERLMAKLQRLQASALVAEPLRRDTARLWAQASRHAGASADSAP